MMRRRLGTIWLVVLILTVACAAPAQPRTQAPSGSTNQAPSAPRRVVAAISGDPKMLTNKLSNVSAGGTPGLEAVEELVNSGVANTTDKGELRPQLAEAVPTTENGLWKLLPDGRMETTWTLKPNARWHDGTAVTADDLLFTMQVAGDKELGAFGDVATEFVESIEATDARTLIVRWKQPFIEANTLFTGVRGRGMPLPKHLLERAFTENKRGFLDVPYWTDEFVGAGPFKLRDFVKGSHLVLTANDDYVLGRPKVDVVELRFILDAPTLAANILAGEIDITMGRGFTQDNGMQIRDQWRDGKMLLTFTSWDAIYTQLLNPTPAVIGDVRFRRALLHAIDREKQAESLMDGLVPVAHVYLSPNAPEYKEVESRIVRYDYDPRRATQLLQEIGYTAGADGMLRDTAGQPLGVEIRAAIQTDTNVKSMLATADDWQRVGVNAERVVIPNQRVPDREYRATMPGFELVRQRNDVGDLRNWATSEIPLADNNWTGRNRSRYSNPTLDALIERYPITIPRPERTRIVADVVQHVTDQVTMMGIFYATQVTMQANRLTNVRLGDATTPAWNAEEWEVR
jgi:peptide/nickel transport system substrate-binding protein